MANTIPAELRAPLREWLLSIADDKLVLGSRNSDWTGLAPILEEDIAFSSMAQDDIGHAAALYQFICEQAGDGRTPDQLAYGRPAEAYRCAELVETSDDFNWAAALVRLFLFAHFDLQRLQRAAGSTFQPLASLGARMAAEKRIHTEHADSWMVRLARGGPDPHARLQDALDALTPAAVALFEPTAGMEALEQAGLLPRQRDAFERWHETIRRVTNDASLRFSAAPHSPEHVGGRRGRHTSAFAELLAEMTEVYREEPEAAW